MTIRQFIDDTSARLVQVYPAQEARAISYRLAEHLWGITRPRALLDPLREVEGGVAEKAVEELLCGRPLQYVLGYEWFCDMKFAVGEGVLIPRPETEELVRWIVGDSARAKGARGLRILDIGTGSGAIAIALAALLPGSLVCATDVSPEALAVAKKNAEANGVEVNFMLSDILNESPDGEWDIIVSNPPYVTEREKEAMRPNVVDYEPHTALFTPGSDPLIFYRKISRYAAERLAAGGRLYFEINENFGGEVVGIVARHGFSDVELREDIFGKERMVYGRKNR